MKLAFLAGMGPLVRDPKASLTFYRDVLGLPVVDDDGYISMDNWQGLRHFGQWTLEDAAEAIFGTRDWPEDVPVPQGNLEFDVEREADLQAAADELRPAGYPPLVGPKTEPWNQSVVRVIGPEGLLISITYTPWLHEMPAGSEVGVTEATPAAEPTAAD